MPPTKSVPLTATLLPKEETAAVRISEQEAAQAILESAIPEIDRRIESSFLTRKDWLRGELVEDSIILIAEDTAGVPLDGLVLPEDLSRFRIRPRTIEGPALLLVEYSDLEQSLQVHPSIISALSGEQDEGASNANNLLEPPSQPGRRQTRIAFFDALGGDYLGSQDCWGSSRELCDQLLQSRVLSEEEILRFSPRESKEAPSPSPTPQPEESVFANLKGDHPATPLAYGEVPAGHYSALHALPFVAGANWKYRVTEQINGFHWRQAECSLEVESSDRIAGDALRISLKEESKLSCFADRTDMPGLHWIMFTSGAIHFSKSPEEETLRPLRLRAGQAHIPPEYREPIADLVALPFGIQTAPPSGWSLANDELHTVIAPAGTFEDCISFISQPGMSYALTMTMCPGIGIVRATVLGSGSMSTGSSRIDLIEYDIPKFNIVR